MKKYIIPILIIILLLLCGAFLIKNLFFYDNEKEIEIYSEIVNGNNENINLKTANIYIGYDEKFEKYDYKIDETKEVIDKAKDLINEIGNIIGYKIVVNDITSGKGGISINFSSEGAPFNDEEAYIGNQNEKHHIYDKNTLICTVFDSIKQTLQNYFGETMEIWYSYDNLQEIKFEEYNFKINLYEKYNGCKYSVYK